MEISSKAVKYGDNINTDLIIPGRYLILTDPQEMGRHAMEGLDPSFIQKSKDGVTMVVGHNFGSGSSREQAPIALKYSGVKCIIAKSFARIFYRNAINLGLPVLEVEDLWDKVDEGDLLNVNLDKGLITNSTKGFSVSAQPLPPFILEIIEKGGLLNKLREMLAKTL
jgi:3-isopropylmalate/(R)-2-methylmalate dehydratase small subunit